MQQNTVYLNLSTAHHVSCGISTHHQELITLYLQYLALMRPLMPDTVDTVLWAPDDGWRYHTKHDEQLTALNKLYSVATSWIIIDMLYDARSIEH